MSASFIPKHPVVTAAPKNPEAFSEAEAMTVFLREKGMAAPCGSLYDEELRKRVKKGEFDMLIAVGGDGVYYVQVTYVLLRCADPRCDSVD